MKVFLLYNDAGEAIFYAEGGDTDGESAPHGGLRGRLERKVTEIRDYWARAETRIAKKLRSVWERLHRRTPADEGMLAKLRTAAEIEIQHPTSVSPEQVRTLWDAYLAQRWRRHWSRLGVNAAICPLTVVFIPLPGPNVIGFWFCYRAARHLLAVLGLKRARGAAVAVRFQPLTALDRPIRAGQGGDRHNELGVDADDLARFLERTEATRSGKARAAAGAGQGA